MVASCRVLSQLLPYTIQEKKKGAELRDTLKHYQILLTVAHCAMQACVNGDLPAFDAHVGENACQIRAWMIVRIFSQHLPDMVLLSERIQSTLTKVDLLLEPQRMNRLMRESPRARAVFDTHDLDLAVTPEQEIMIASYLLCQAKTQQKCDRTMPSIYGTSISSPHHMRFCADVSGKFANHLATHVKEFLSHASVQFVQDMAGSLPERPHLQEMVSEHYTMRHPFLPFIRCIPMFWTYQTLMFTAQKERIPLVLKVKFLEGTEGEYRVAGESCLVLTPADNGVYQESTDADPEAAACVIAGVVTSDQNGQLITADEWRARIQAMSVEDVVFAGAADHRQFPDAALDAQFEDDKEYQRYKVMAQTTGCSAENPTTFFIQHVYASKVGRA